MKRKSTQDKQQVTCPDSVLEKYFTTTTNVAKNYAIKYASKVAINWSGKHIRKVAGNFRRNYARKVARN